jgi:radical SAM protein with 4Fe4S-binding SPASM domain
MEALAAAGKIFHGDAFFASRGYSSSPVLVQWMVTEACPLSCEICLLGSTGRGPEMTLDEAAGLLDQVAAMNVRELLLTGGEPLARPDLPEIIAMMKARGIRWSLNTSLFPHAAARRAMEDHPPSFVAVSLDGPEPVHDRVRGMPGSFARNLAAMGWYADLTEGRVAAGTTLSRLNFPALEDTFRIVLKSGAGSWGLHLVFPEGRARRRSDLFLDRRQVRSLLHFVERKRRHFRVTLADEIGYTGAMEPLLRDSPFFCGAGRTQCVILSDGEVVPCTTTDRSVSAGNVREQGLEEIWHGAFEDLRERRLPARCRACEFAALCGGGCWLQRRRGMHCFKESWIAPRSLAAAAGLALCLGGAACAPQGGVEVREPAEVRSIVLLTPDLQGKTPGKAEDKKKKKKEAKVQDEMPEALEYEVLGWYFEETQGSNPLAESPKTESAVQAHKKKLASDPAAKYLKAMKAGKWPKDLKKRCQRIQAALKTKFRSLAFISLLWRDLTLWCLDGPGPGKRTAEEAKLLAETLDLLEKTAAEWKKEIIKNKVDAFIAAKPQARHHWFMMSKALFPHEQFRAALANLSMEHWGLEKYTDDVSDDVLLAHPLGDGLRLEFETSKGSGLKKVSAGAASKVGSKGSLGIFDRLVVPGPGKGNGPVLTFQMGSSATRVTLPAGAELGYGDVLRLAYDQNKKEMDEAAQKAAAGYGEPPPSPLLLPALEHMAKTLPDTDAAKAPARRTALGLWLF